MQQDKAVSGKVVRFLSFFFFFFGFSIPFSSSSSSLSSSSNSSSELVEFWRLISLLLEKIQNFTCLIFVRRLTLNDVTHKDSDIIENLLEIKREKQYI